MIDNTIIVEIDMPNEIDVDLGDAKFITAPEKQVPQAVPQIDVDNNGLITATSVQEAGSVRAGTTKSIYQLAVEQGKTISPSGESQVAIEKGRFAVGDIVVSPLKVQAKELNVTDGGNYEVVPDNDYLLSKVRVNVDISSKVDEAFQSGVKSEYDRFWDAIQNKGDYSCSNIDNLDIPRTEQRFGVGWTNAIFKPKYDVIVLNGNTFTYSEIEDLRPETVGVNIDFSRLNNFNYILRKAKTKYIGIVDMTNAVNGWCLFASAYNLEYVEKVILPPTKDLAFKQMGFNVSNLTHIAFENKFFSAVQFNACTKLTHQSLLNVLDSLYDYVNGDLDGSSKNKTCTLGATNLAKLTDAEKAIATEKGWTLA